jgi:hypothetical protein
MKTPVAQLAGWCPEALRVAQQLALDMEKAGIHLPQPQRGRMQVGAAPAPHVLPAPCKPAGCAGAVSD